MITAAHLLAAAVPVYALGALLMVVGAVGLLWATARPGERHDR